MRFSTLATSVLVLTFFACKDPNPSNDGAGDSKPVDPNDPAAHEVPSEGTTQSGLEGVDDAIKAWMRSTCTGAVTFALGFEGEPIVTRGYGFASGPPNAVCGKPGDEFSGIREVGPNTPMRLGSNSKAITAAVTRIVLKQKLASMGRPTTDTALESLLVFDDALDLVSPRLRRAVQGAAATGSASCVSVPGGSRVLPGGQIDPRWQSMTVGHLLGHRSGLPRGGNPITAKLPTIRGIDTFAKIEAEAELAGASAPVRESLASAVPNAHFLRPQTLEEYLLGNLDLCLDFSPGGPLPPTPGFDPYSNIAYGILQHVAEHVSGRGYTAPLGAPSEHPESLLAQFTSTRLGFDKGVESKYGMYAGQPILGMHDVAEPSYRGWDGKSLRGMFADTKRPFCVWNDESKSCDTTAFTSGNVRYHWKWKNELVPVGYEIEGFSAGPGLIVTEMPLMLRFLAKYWVNGAGAVPFYGRERATNPSSSSRWHIGALRGTHSVVAQFMGDSVDYFVVPRKEGELDLATFQAYPTDAKPDASCVLPKGLDMAISANQNDDQVCATEGSGACAFRYMALRDVVKEALCKVSWMKVNPKLATK
ncbi:MAG: serine hydrolase [Labilithrix sp.]|nr:serine hydrolase [Labilithrix sp.]